MPTIAVYRQARFDGGVRTGIEIDGSTALQRFDDGSEEVDPALLWWIDVLCTGENLPDEPESVRQWFLQNADWIKDGLRAVAKHLEAGFDTDIYPLDHAIATPDPHVTAKVAASAIRRIQARELTTKLLQLREEWNEALASLSPLARV